MTTFSVKLLNAQQARGAILDLCNQLHPYLVAGRPFTLEAFDGKSRDQERLCHSCYRDIARDALLAGAKADASLWKESLKYAFYLATKDMPEFAEDWKRRRPRMVPLIDGDGFVMTPVESKNFTKGLYSAYITFLHATGDARGVRWSVTSLGREDGTAAAPARQPDEPARAPAATPAIAAPDRRRPAAGPAAAPRCASPKSSLAPA